MKRQPVTSSLIQSVGYDPARNVLELEFASGAIYEYEDVSEETYKRLLSADSLGAYFNTEIKDAYHTEKIG
jgi:hypothetical protein